MAPIVLVHGAWHEGRCWQRLTPLPRDRGHGVHRAPLTGLGAGQGVMLTAPGVLAAAVAVGR